MESKPNGEKNQESSSSKLDSKIKPNGKYLKCDRCQGPVIHSEGLTEEDKAEFKEIFETEEFLCEKCTPHRELTPDQEAEEIKEFMEDLFEEFYEKSKF